MKTHSIYTERLTHDNGANNDTKHQNCLKSSNHLVIALLILFNSGT